MLRKTITAVMLTAAVATTTVAVSTNEAEAGRWHRGFAAGVAGGVALGILGSALAHPHHAPAPAYGAPPMWSDAWFDYCLARYRSFDPDSGTYMTRRGVRRYCR